MICEILSVGTELLMGQIANTDAQYISSRLSEFGISVYRQVTVGDNPQRVKEALNTALSRSDLVITTGGLGPTEDDLTKEMVAEYFGLPMELHQPSLDALTERIRRYHPGRPVTENNLKQAYFPKGAVIMKNSCGTAPGCIVERDGKAVAVLPGPPREMRAMFEGELTAYLEKISDVRIHSRFLKIFGVGESNVESILQDLFHLENPTLALYCGTNEVQARMSVQLPKGEDPGRVFDPVEREIRRRLGDAVYAVGRGETIESTVFRLLRDRKKTVVFAESCTGGLLASMLIENAGASDVLRESYVTYGEETKVRILGVRQRTVDTVGVVSTECAAEMAEGARRISGADYAVSVTGVAGPDGGTPENPVGTVYVGVADERGTCVKRFCFLGDRDRSWVRNLAAAAAFNMLRLRILGREIEGAQECAKG
ncbi:MAG: competence/damage-inducible protein A [Clostridia bacterium]|nr:competence/damage-inducible protein A [Clostridia bacterium]